MPVGFSTHFLLMQLLCENCKSLSDHAVPRIRVGVRLGYFKLPALLQGARSGWKVAQCQGVRSRPGGLPEEWGALGTTHGSIRLAGERKVQRLSPGCRSGWWRCWSSLSCAAAQESLAIVLW